ncbi:cupin domain-containing protein [Salinibacterium sp. ZJ450]|uniref:cupin domain-containing protein n=1 Tax=Salinibacterium sp. ZJ450 TaxID=2708338 RepID=UPI0014218EBD|nr:cupin domain-containing protein [Salinibacterium sp. ZJ450]
MPKITKFRADEVVPEQYDVEADSILEGNPQQASTVTWRSEDGTVVAGIFRSTIGKFSFQQLGHESTLVRKGHVIVTADDGSSVDCRPGDVMNIAQDAVCVFDVREDLEDYFVIVNSAGVDL